MTSVFFTNLAVQSFPAWYNNRPMAGNYIKHYRKAAGLTQEDLSEKLGTTPATVQRHEAGKRGLSYEWIIKYSNALAVHPSDIMEGPVSEADPKEKELIDSFRQLEDSAKQMYLHTLKSFAAGDADKKQADDQSSQKECKK